VKTARELARLARLLSLVVLVLAACLVAGPLTGTARAESPAGTSVTLWHSYRGNEERALLQVVADYQRIHPDRHVEVLALPFEAFSSKLSSAVPLGHGPDLFVEAHERLGSYLRDGIVSPIDAGLPDGDVSAYDETALRAVTVDGVRYGVPLASKCLALYRNPKLLPHPPATLEELASDTVGIPAGGYPFAYDSTSAFYHAPFLHAFGGRMVDDAGNFAFVGPDTEASLSFVRQLQQTRQVPQEASGALLKELFVTGQTAAVIDGPWLAADLGTDLDYVVDPLPPIAAARAFDPAGQGTMRPFLTVDGLFLTPNGARNPAAKTLARYLGGPESARVRAMVGKQVVTRRSVWSEPDIAADTRLAAFHLGAADAIPTPSSAAMRASWVPANQAILKVLRGDLDPHDATLEAQRRFLDVMRAPPPPASPAPALLLLGALILGGAFFAVSRARRPEVRAQLRASLPAYRYVAHAVLAVLALVILPLLAGALTSLFVGTRHDPRYVGLANYVAILTARGGPLLAHGSFWLTLLVTVLWTVVNVFFHVTIGLALGVALARPTLRLKSIYRVLLILPWAVPSYVTALAWKGMFHRQFGAVNAILKLLGVEPVSWFSHFSTAFAANVATNVWLGFPFMMVVVLGALTSISTDVLEAAAVDGATRWQRFRLVTLPLLWPVLLPAVVLGAVWTFNMFNVVFLVSGGEPDETTDLLLSEAYRWAFTRDAQYGYAAAYAVLIFVLIAGSARLLSRIGRRDEAEAR
jgi:arabinogalactan oligomer/maltooligosaccharide transport system permease protein